MAKKLFNEIGWKYALGEIFFIFIGITMAIGFRSWIEDQKAKEVELSTIKEIREGIKTDLLDINENLEGYSWRIAGFEKIIEHIEKRLPPDKNMKVAYFQLLSFTKFISNIGPYETLKSRGMGIISNDSLRSHIAHYYDTEYERITSLEALHIDHYIRYKKPQALAKFYIDGYEMEPVNYQALLDDFEFAQVVRYAVFLDKACQGIYQEVKESGENLVLSLDREIERLEKQ